MVREVHTSVYGPMPRSGVSPRVFRVRTNKDLAFMSQDHIAGYVHHVISQGVKGIQPAYGTPIPPAITEPGNYRVVLRDLSTDRRWISIWRLTNSGRLFRVR